MKESLHRDTLQARWEAFSAGEWDPTRRWNKRAPGELKNVDIIKTANLKMWILLKPLDFKIDFFGRKDYFKYVFYTFRECHFLERTKIEIPYCSQGLPQLIMIFH